MSFQRQTAATRIGFLSPYFGFAPMPLLTWTSVSGGSARSWLNQLSPGFPWSTAHILDQISGSHLFCGGRELVWGVPLHISCSRTVWWLRCSKTIGPSRPHFSRAPWSQGTGVWSLASWQHSRLYWSSCRCVPAFSPALLKVRDHEEMKMPTFFLISLHKGAMCKSTVVLSSNWKQPGNRLFLRASWLHNSCLILFSTLLHLFCLAGWVHRALWKTVSVRPTNTSVTHVYISSGSAPSKFTGSFRFSSIDLRVKRGTQQCCSQSIRCAPQRRGASV